MTYQTFINKLRLELRDFGEIHKEVFDGDGTTRNFLLSHTPILENTYTVKVDGVVKTETTDYNINKDNGLITFETAPAAGSDNVEISYQSVKIKDSDYLELANDAIDHFQWTFWEINTDETSLTTVKNQYEYDLSSISSNILYLLKLQYKTSTSATYWEDVSDTTNYKYKKTENKLYIDPPFNTASLPMRLTFLQSFTKGSSLTDTFPVPDKWILPYKYYIYARFYERQVPERISDVSAITTSASFLPGPSVINVAEYYYKKAEEIARRVAPKLPSQAIRNTKDGIVL